MSKRVQTKDLYQRVGRPEFTPQAKASTFAYVAPQSSSQGNTLEQLGAAGLVAADAVAKWGARGMQKEESEGLKEGKRLALIAFRKNGMKAFRAAEVNGDIENADNPFVKKFYLNTMGQLAANSEAFQNHLMKGSKDEILQQIYNDQDSDGFDAWAHENILARVDSFMEGMPNSRFMRDEGFGEAAVAVVEKAKQSYSNLYKNKISELNVDGLTETLNQGLDRGELQDTYDYYNGVWKGSADGNFPEFGKLKSTEGVAPRNTLPVEINQRLFWFKRVEGNVLGGISSKTSLSHAQSYRDALTKLTGYENLVNKSDNTKARSGTSRVMYDDLRNTLKKGLSDAERVEVARREAASKSADKLAGDLFTMTAAASAPTVKIDQMGLLTGADLELPKQVGDPGQFSADWWKKLKRGELKNPITGETLWWLPRDEEKIKIGGKMVDNPAYGNSMSPTRAEMEIMDDRFVMQAVVEEITAVRTSIAAEYTETNRIRTQGKNALEAALSTFKQSIVDRHRGLKIEGSKKVPWSDRTVYDMVDTHFNHPTFGLADEVLKWNLEGVRIQALSDVRDAMEKNFGESKHPEPRQRFVSGLDYIFQNMGRLGSMSDAERQSELIKTGKQTAEDAKSLSELVTRQAKPYLSYFSFREGKEGKMLMSAVMDRVLRDVPKLDADMYKGGQGRRAQGYRYAGPMYRVLHHELGDHMREEYLPLVRQLGTMFNLNSETPAFKTAIEAALWQSGAGPVIIPHPTQKTPAGTPVMVQILPYSVLHSFKMKGKQPNFYLPHAPTGATPSTTRQSAMLRTTVPTAMMASTGPLGTAWPAGHQLFYLNSAGQKKYITGRFQNWQTKLEARKHGQ